MFENRPRLPTGCGGNVSSCSKLGQNLSEMEVRIFVKIQRVIWDHFLAFKAEIIQKQALFSVSVLNNSLRIIMSSSYLCSLLCFFFCSRS